MLPHSTQLTRRRRALLAAGLPALAAAAAVAWPCDCPDHRATHSAAHLAAVRPGPDAAAHAMHAGHAAGPASGATEHVGHAAGPAPSSAHSAGHGDGFVVGTAERPIVSRGAPGPLWRESKPQTPGRAMHGTFAEIAVAKQLDDLRAQTSAVAASEPVAERAAVLTTSQATKKLSKKCQRLLKAKKSKLKKADRKRRTACLEQRRKLVEASKPTTGASAPAAPIQGPKPTTAAPALPATGTDAPVPDPGTATPTTPATTPTTPAPDKVYRAVGIEPNDSIPSKWGFVSRSFVEADIVSFQLRNTDQQEHNLYIAPGNAAGEVTGALTKVIDELAPGETESQEVALQPGIYILICTVPGHDQMKVKLAVYAPGPAG